MQILLFLFSCVTQENSAQETLESDWFMAGKQVYKQKCSGCHKEYGQGVEGVFPPIKGSQWIIREPELIASIITRGLGGEITVRGETYRSAMPPQDLTAQQTFNVIAYIRFAFAQKKPDFTIVDIQRIHKNGGGTIYGQDELYEIFGQ
jgi:mono/diheme cytochrome c family protein